MPYFPANFLNPHRLALLKTAKSVGIEKLRMGQATQHFKDKTINLSRLSSLELLLVVSHR